MRRAILFIFISLANFSVVTGQDIKLLPAVNLRFSGNFSAEGWYFPRKAPQPATSNHLKQVAGLLDLTFQFKAPLELRINQRFQFDFDNDDRNRYEIEDLYLDYFGSSFEARAGWQIFSWKTVESISQADFLNQTDLESDFFDADKLSQLALRLRYIPATDVEQVFEIYYLPWMRATRLPVGKNRFAFGQLNIQNDPNRHRYQSEKKQWRPQFAVSYQRSFFEQVDTRLFYFNGYNRFPGIVPFAPGSSNEFVHEYRLVHKSGLAFQGELDAWLLKGELVYTAYRKALFNQLAQSVQPKYFAYTLGFEYTFYSSLFRNQDIGTIFEVIGDTDSGKKPEDLEGYRPFRNHIFTGIRYAFNNVGDRTILLGGFFDYREGDVILSVEYEERIAEVFTVNLTYTDLIVETSPLDLFGHADRFLFEVKWHF